MSNHKNVKAVIRVGKGRGFLVEGGWIITAGHCLPKLPPSHPCTYTEERTYPKLLGPLHGECTAWAECVFVDPVEDVAALAAPDGQTYYDESDRFCALIETMVPLPVRAASPGTSWLLGLDGDWSPCQIETSGTRLRLKQAQGGILGGMSGSPILDSEGYAVGMVNSSGGTGIHDEVHTEGSAPSLSETLPGWLLRRLLRQL